MSAQGGGRDPPKPKGKVRGGVAAWGPPAPGEGDPSVLGAGGASRGGGGPSLPCCPQLDGGGGRLTQTSAPSPLCDLGPATAPL